MMDRKKAADLLDNLIGMVEDSHGADYDTALRMGIEALSANGDTIYRQAALDMEFSNGISEDGVLYVPYREVKMNLEELPSAQPTEASCWGCNCPKMERLKEQKTFSEMVHLHDAETHEERTETHACDLISRQAAIDSIEKHLRFGDELYPLTDTDKVLNHGFEIAASCVYNLPSAQPEPQWIPCERNLPEDYTDVLAWFEYFRYGDYNCLYQTYGIGSYSMEYDSWMINHETGWRKLRVIAWMPLPEPWRGEEHENSD